MAHEARQFSAAPQWHNHLPVWIRNHTVYTEQNRANRTSRNVIQAIADACDRDQFGNLVGAFGPSHLAKRAGVSLATFWRHIRRLEPLGLVVVLARGGVQGAGSDGPKRIISNTFGIPAAAGSLDHVRARRRAQCMRPTGEYDSRGRPIYAPDVTKPGDQATLFKQRRLPSPESAGYSKPGEIGSAAAGPSRCPDAPQREGHQNEVKRGELTLPPPRFDTTPVSQRHDPSVAMTLHHHHEHRPGDGNHGAAPANRRDGARSPRNQRRRKSQVNAFGGPCIAHIDSEDMLRDTAAMRLRYQAERRRGAVRMTELNWLAVAERALRVVREEEVKYGTRGSAAALFASIVNRELWAFVDSAGVAHFQVSEDDEQRARRRMQAARSDDHVLVQAALDMKRRTGADALNAIRSMRPRGGWTRERFDRIVAELRQAGAVP